MADIPFQLGAPTNYSAEQIQPDIYGNYQLGQQTAAQTGLVNAQTQNQLVNTAANAFALQRQQQLVQDMHSYAQNPTPQKTVELMGAYPQFADQIKGAYNTMGQAFTQTATDYLGRAQQAALHGNYDLAAKIMKDYNGALQSLGVDPTNPTMQRLQSNADEITQELSSGDPRMQKIASGSLGAHLAGILGPDNYLRNFAGATTMGETQKQAGLTTVQQAQNIELNAKKFNMEAQQYQQGLILSYAKLGLDLRKSDEPVINQAVNDSYNANLQAQRLDNLDKQLSDVESQFTPGAPGKAKEWFKEQFGNQDVITDLRKQGQQAIASAGSGYFKGHMTDKDLSFAQSFSPTEKTSPSELHRFFTVQSNMQKLVGRVNDAKALWQAQQHNLGAAQQDMVIGGIRVPQGMSFSTFMQKYGDKMAVGTPQPTAGAGMLQAPGQVDVSRYYQ